MVVMGVEQGVLPHLHSDKLIYVKFQCQVLGEGGKAYFRDA